MEMGRNNPNRQFRASAMILILASVTIATGTVAEDASDFAETLTTLEVRLRELRETEAAVDTAKKELASLEVKIAARKAEAEEAQKPIAQRDAALEGLEAIQRQPIRVGAEKRASRTRFDAQKEELDALETRRMGLDDEISKARSEYEKQQRIEGTNELEVIQNIVQSLILMAAGWAFATLWQGNEQRKVRQKLQAILREGERRVFNKAGWEIRGDKSEMPPERIRQKMVFELMAAELMELAKHATPKATVKQWTVLYRTGTEARRWNYFVGKLSEDESRESLDEPIRDAFDNLRKAINP